MSALGEIRTPNRLIRRCIFTTSPVVILSHRIAYTPLSDRISETSRFSLPTSASECEVKVGLELGSRSDTQLTFRVLQEALLTFMWMPGLLWKAYEMKESLRAIFPGDLEIDEVHEMLDRWCRRASEYETTEFNPTFKDHPNAEEKGFSPPLQAWSIQREGRETQHMSSFNHCPLGTGFIPSRLPWPWYASFSDRLT